MKMSILAVILAVVVGSLLITNVSATEMSESTNQTMVQFIYTGRLIPTVPGALDRIFIANQDDLINKQIQYFDKYGIWNYVLNRGANQLYRR